LHYRGVLSSMQERETKKIRKALGEVIRTHRTSVGISQERLAELVDVHRNYIGKIERGEQNITINSLCRFATVFKRPLSGLLAEAGF